MLGFELAVGREIITTRPSQHVIFKLEVTPSFGKIQNYPGHKHGTLFGQS